MEENLDEYYLYDMSADAAGSILQRKQELSMKSDLTGEERRFLNSMDSYIERIKEEAIQMDFRSFNVSVFWANQILKS